jgi:hypothetical protein
MLGRKETWSPMRRAMIFADQFLPWLPAQFAKARDRLESLERHVLTEFLLGSNFFRTDDPRKETIVYSSAIPACANPFKDGQSFSFSAVQETHPSPTL